MKKYLIGFVVIGLVLIGVYIANALFGGAEPLVIKKTFCTKTLTEKVNQADGIYEVEVRKELVPDCFYTIRALNSLSAGESQYINTEFDIFDGTYGVNTKYGTVCDLEKEDRAIVFFKNYDVNFKHSDPYNTIVKMCKTSFIADIKHKNYILQLIQAKEGK